MLCFSLDQDRLVLLGSEFVGFSGSGYSVFLLGLGLGFSSLGCTVFLRIWMFVFRIWIVSFADTKMLKCNRAGKLIR
jgi:hypothetical protein